MSFLSQFSKYFNSEQKGTELYGLWSAIGVNTEKAILEEIERIDTEMTDINSFSEDTLRSWLAFFLQKIPYRTTATVQVTTSLNNELVTNTSGSSQNEIWKYSQTVIPQYSQLKNDDGYVYTTLEQIILNGTDERTVTAVQGRRIVEQGTYNSIIKIQATNPDLSYMTVTLNGVEIPEVSYQTSYDQLSFMGSWKPQNEDEKTFGGTPFLQNAYGTKGQFYTVISDGYCKFSEDGVATEFRVGDIVVFDGVEWQRSAATNNLQPIQFANTYAVPYNGYFAYYYGGYLYVKIYSGTEVDNPEGQLYTVSYISSNGVLGETNANTLKYISTYQDSNEQSVELNVSNSKSSVAVNEPGVGKLGLYLKQRLYGSINVSSVPEYTSWFKSQPEVGDCMVLSDWEKYRRSGSYTKEGYVDVFLTDNNGDDLSDEVKEELLDRIEPYKDIAVLRLVKFDAIYNYYVIRYTTVNDNDSFEQFVKSVVGQFYSLPYLQSISSSLFESVDLALVAQTIQDNQSYKSTGLTVKGYHYYKNPLQANPTLTFSIISYDGEKPGDGWYILTKCDADGNPLKDDQGQELPKLRLFEDAQPDGVSAIIYDTNDISVEVGLRVRETITFTLQDQKYDCPRLLVECYWGMKNEGILAIGSQNGLRRLKDVDVQVVL